MGDLASDKLEGILEYHCELVEIHGESPIVVLYLFADMIFLETVFPASSFDDELAELVVGDGAIVVHVEFVGYVEGVGR